MRRWYVATAVWSLAACATTTNPSSASTAMPAPSEPQATPTRDVEAFRQQWHEQVNTEQVAAVSAMCEREAATPTASASMRAEALVCRAVVALKGAKIIASVRPSGVLVPIYDGPALNQALQFLRQATDLMPTAFAPRRELINVLMYTANAGEALVAELRAALTHHHDDANLQNDWLPLANSLYERGDYQTMLDALMVMVERWPQDARIVANIGAALMLLNRDADALPFVQQSVELSPQDPLNRHNLGEWYARNSQLPAADEHFKRALELATNDAEKREYGCYYAAFLQAKVKDHARAKEVATTYGCDKSASGNLPH